MAIQKLVGVSGFGKQTAKGSALANAVYGVGLMDGNVFTSPITQSYEDITLPGGANDRIAPGVNRTAIQPGAHYKTRAYAMSVAAFLRAALGANADSGAGPYTHIATPALALSYHTLFGKYGTGEYVKLPDCKLDTLTISWDGTSPLELEATWLGLAPAINASSFTYTNDETTVPWYTPNAGIFQIDVKGTTLAAAKVVGGSISIMNNLDPIVLSKNIYPDDLEEGEQVIEGVIKLKPDDLNDWHSIFSGSTGGTTVENDPVYGSFSLKHILDGSTDLILASGARVAFLCDFPASDPKGGAMEIDLAFSVTRPTDGSNALTATARNSLATL